MSREKLEKAITEHGEWTAMSIRLSDGTYTRQQDPDHRLRRLVQVAADASRKPLSECRVLDLACLEGHYAIEFAKHGAEAVGIEGRSVSVAKCNFVRDDLGLTRLSFIQDDVRNISRETHGQFDIVICSGILYHLKAADAAALVTKLAEVSRGIVLIDTFIALSSQTKRVVDGTEVHGHIYFEHAADDSDETKKSKLWSSLDNEDSFWFTEATLVNLLQSAGFTTVSEILSPTMPGNLADRKTYLAIKGAPVRILTSEKTECQPRHPIPEGKNIRVDASQHPRGVFYRIAKALVPDGVKHGLKPALRAVRILPPDGTPEFMKKKTSGHSSSECAPVRVRKIGPR